MFWETGVHLIFAAGMRLGIFGFMIDSVLTDDEDVFSFCVDS